MNTILNTMQEFKKIVESTTISQELKGDAFLCIVHPSGASCIVALVEGDRILTKRRLYSKTIVGCLDPRQLALDVCTALWRRLQQISC